MIKFRHLIWMMIATAGLMLSVSQSFAQQPDVGDQPGLLPDDSAELDPEYRKQMVFYRTTEAPGTIIISTAERHLYLIQGNGRALRYGIGVGREGFQWQGLLNISRKAEWPDWTPPPEMIARQPYLPRFMAGGPGNPLGARAMYLGSTVYRIHGTNRPDTIGTAVSSGCFRLVNADVTDLYERVPAGTKAGALQNRKVDILSRNSTWSMSRETSYDLYFPAVAYYDGEGFMVPRARKIDSALDLTNSKVCVQAETTTQLNLADYFRANNMKYQEMKFAKLDEVIKAYDSGQCDTLTADVSQLYALRLNLGKPGDHIILPDVISKEPLAPVVRQRDDDWMMIVKWTLYAMINAEELGVTSKNIDEALKSRKPDVMRLVGTEGTYGEDLGVTKDWAARIIRRVGNYGEIYDRNIGAESKLKIPRGLNQLWSAGGIQYAPPIR